MTDRELREKLKQNKIASQYVLIGEEPLLIENAISAIKDTLNVEDGFDFESFSINEVPVNDIIAKLVTSPFLSARRMIIAKNLEELDKRELMQFAKTIAKISTQNCFIMTYRLDKHEKRQTGIWKNIGNLFPHAQCVMFESGKQHIHKWIVTKNKRDNLQLSPSTIHYLEEEFQNDITGLKNEFDKIENYLHEAKNLDGEAIRTLAKGLCDFNKYAVVDAYVKGNKNAFLLLEELKPYLNSCAEIVDALARSLLYFSQRLHNENALQTVKTTLCDIVDIDHAVKRGSQFDYTMLELLFLKKDRMVKKGAKYGR